MVWKWVLGFLVWFIVGFSSIWACGRHSISFGCGGIRTPNLSVKSTSWLPIELVRPYYVSFYVALLSIFSLKVTRISLPRASILDYLVTTV